MISYEQKEKKFKVCIQKLENSNDLIYNNKEIKTGSL